MAAPLQSRDRALGAIVVERERGAFTENEATFFQALAREVAFALDKALLWKENQKQLAEIEGLNRRLSAKVEQQTAELAQAQRELLGRYRYDRLVGRSAAMQRVLAAVDRVIPTELPVLIQGASGTGKELVARTIHYNGARAQRRFLSENCAAISPALLESELFGHVKGAFTGATSDRIGLFEHADGGTLFLDEIGDLELDLQAKLLRVLEEGKVRPVGSERQRSVNVRILAASNRELRELSKQGRFREDLYYRLAVVTIHLPTLAERLEDLPELVSAILAEYAAAHGEAQRTLAPEAYRLLAAHSWPGNVRELKNLIEKLVVFTSTPQIGAAEIEAHLVPERPAAPDSGLLDEVAELPYKEAKRLFEKAYLARALGRAQGNISRTASAIGLDRRYLYDLLDKHGMRPA